MKQSLAKTTDGKLKFTGGVYKGPPVCEAPSEYLLWLRFTYREFVHEFDLALRERGVLPGPTVARGEEVIVAGKHALAQSIALNAAELSWK